LDEKAEILMLERGPLVSYANCGLPYYVGGSIEEESSLLVATEEMFRDVFEVDCRTNCEVVSINAEQKTVELNNRLTGEVSTESYDKLVLSPGAAPIRPPLPGIDLPGIFSVRTVADAVDMRKWLERDIDRSVGNSIISPDPGWEARRAVVVGGGFIGLELVENLVERGLSVTLVEKLNQVMLVLTLPTRVI
jgi:NADPH-dependent 2,4-dienoyl-CoA reductase/sulfur reductase-like enzyme